jgi:hypothetical protein
MRRSRGVSAPFPGALARILTTRSSRGFPRCPSGDGIVKDPGTDLGLKQGGATPLRTPQKQEAWKHPRRGLEGAFQLFRLIGQ